MSIIIREFVHTSVPSGFTRIGVPFRAGGQVHFVALHEACGRHVVLRSGASGKYHCWHCKVETREATHQARLLPEDTTDCPRCGNKEPQVMARRRDRGGYRSMRCVECRHTWMQSCPLDAPISCSRIFVLNDGCRVSLQQIAEACNVSKWTITTWIKAGLTADAILAGERPKKPPAKRKLRRYHKYRWQGRRCSIRELAELAGISHAGMCRRLALMPVDQAMDFEPKLGRRIPFRGETKSLTELARIAGVCVTTMRKRLWAMSPDEAVQFRPPKPIGSRPRQYLFRGQMLTVVELAQIATVQPSTIGARLRDGMTPEAAVALGDQRSRKGIQRTVPRRWQYQGQDLTAMELASVAGISLAQMRRRLELMPVDEAVGKAKRRFIRVDREKLAEAIQKSGVGEFTIRARLRRGMTLDEAAQLGRLGKGKRR
ncbi:MAG: hypothetical protein U0996_24960 [Planctomycetaceae bacterium]